VVVLGEKSESMLNAIWSEQAGCVLRRSICTTMENKAEARWFVTVKGMFWS